MADTQAAQEQGFRKNRDGSFKLDASGNKIPVKKALFKKLAQFQTPDGKVFQTQKEASEHLRIHLVHEALLKVTGGDEKLKDWLLENKEGIIKAYKAAEAPRPPVSEETKRKMREALAKRMLPKAAGK